MAIKRNMVVIDDDDLPKDIAYLIGDIIARYELNNGEYIYLHSIKTFLEDFDNDLIPVLDLFCAHNNLDMDRTLVDIWW